MKLLIGNKNYSSWSMRPWVLMKALDIPFEERAVRFDFTPDSAFYREVLALAPTGKVPVLVADDGLAIWDSLAIVEYLAERCPDRAVWPKDAAQRARARTLSAEMHSGFGSLRSLCPMNIDAELSVVGQRLLAREPGLKKDLARIGAMWTEALAASGGPFLFGAFGAADAFFAPVVMRVTRYGLPLPEAAMAYARRVEQVPAVQAWVDAAMAEKDFLDFEEPYRDVSGPTPVVRPA